MAAIATVIANWLFRYVVVLHLPYFSCYSMLIDTLPPSFCVSICFNIYKHHPINNRITSRYYTFTYYITNDIPPNNIARLTTPTTYKTMAWSLHKRWIWYPCDTINRWNHKIRIQQSAHTKMLETINKHNNQLYGDVHRYVCVLMFTFASMSFYVGT